VQRVEPDPPAAASAAPPRRCMLLLLLLLRCCMLLLPAGGGAMRWAGRGVADQQKACMVNRKKVNLSLILQPYESMRVQQ
jgi:hypothetical protein